MEQLSIHQHLTGDGAIGHGVLPRQIGGETLGKGGGGGRQAIGHGGG